MFWERHVKQGSVVFGGCNPAGLDIRIGKQDIFLYKGLWRVDRWALFAWEAIDGGEGFKTLAEAKKYAEDFAEEMPNYLEDYNDGTQTPTTKKLGSR